ncbi:MAG: LamG domain-containing protein, partial [archaeon]
VIGGVGVGTNLIEKIDGLIYLTPLVQFIDDAPPSIAAVSAINATAVRVVFSEKVKSSAESVGKYGIDLVSVYDADLLSNNKTIILRVSPGHDNNTVYNLTVTSIFDLKGNEMLSGWKTYLFIQEPVSLIIIEHILHQVVYPQESNKVFGKVQFDNGTAAVNAPVDIFINNQKRTIDPPASWTPNAGDFRFRCNITIAENDGFGRAMEIIVLTADFLNDTCPNILGAMENSIRVYKYNTVLTPSQVDDWNSTRTGKDLDPTIDENDEIIFYADPMGYGQEFVTIYYDDFYNTPRSYPSDISYVLDPAKTLRVSTGAVNFSYNLSGDYPGLVNITTSGSVLINTSDPTVPKKYMDGFPGVAQGNLAVDVIFNGPVRATYSLKGTASDRDEHIQVYDNHQFWKVIYNDLPDTTDVEYHLLLVKGTVVNQFVDGDPWTGAFQPVVNYTWQEWSGNTGVGAIMPIENDDTLFLNETNEYYNYLRVHESSHSTIYSNSTTDLRPGYFWLHATDFSHAHTAYISKILRNPVTVTVKGEDVLLHTGPAGKYKFYFEAPASEGWFDLRVNSTMNSIPGRTSKQFYTSYNPLVYLVAPGDRRQKAMPGFLYCNATDYKDLLNISLWGNWTGTWERNATVNIHELEPDTGVLFLLRFNNTFKDLVDGASPLENIDARLIEGRWGQGVYFTSKYCNLTYSSVGNIDADEGTIAFWVKSNASWGQDEDWAFFSSTNHTRCRGFEIWRDRNGITKFTYHGTTLSGGPGSDCQPEGAVSAGVDNSDWRAGEWHHIAATWNSTTSALFLDGERAIQRTYGPRTFQTTNRMQLGNLLPRAQRYGPNSTMDEFIIYDKVLDVDEIKDIYKKSDPVHFLEPKFAVDLPSGEYHWNCIAANRNGAAWSQQGNYSFLVP